MKPAEDCGGGHHSHAPRAAVVPLFRCYSCSMPMLHRFRSAVSNRFDSTNNVRKKSCCESYIFRLYLLAFTVFMVVLALLVASGWMLYEVRNNYFRNRLRRSDTDEQARIEMASFEETKYLRRYSELNPLQARKHSFEM
ncbi:unnamed protein product [Caenorhabditis auriculariae]|uniref:Uncharacterized protein n=1 Tax=Caenorhabditis auriculariae TaxID=2777116 RepID=A0A8S1HAT1_9PELO|nr:unnamed protein product [Caenorhabditis auriculariae]